MLRKLMEIVIIIKIQSRIRQIFSTMILYYLNSKKNNTICLLNFFFKNLYTICVRSFCTFGSYVYLPNILIYQSSLIYSLSLSPLHKLEGEKMAILIFPKVVEICRIKEKRKC